MSYKDKDTDFRKGSREALAKEFGDVLGTGICGFDTYPSEAVCDCS